MLLPGETIDNTFAPSFQDADYTYHNSSFFKAWNVPEVSLPAPTFEAEDIKAAVWVPYSNISLRAIIEVPVVAVSVPEDTEEISAFQKIWFGGSLRYEELARYPRNMDLARAAIEGAFLGAYTLYGVIDYLKDKFPEEEVKILDCAS